jgi:hypothetical protein
MTRSAMPSRFELIDLTTPEPRQDEGPSSAPNPPIIDLVSPEPGDADSPKIPSPPINDLLIPRRVPVIDLSTPQPEQLVAALSVSVRALVMSQHRAPGLQLLTPDLRRFLLNQRPHPKPNLIMLEWHIIATRTPNARTAKNGIMLAKNSCLRTSWPTLPAFWA